MRCVRWWRGWRSSRKQLEDRTKIKILEVRRVFLALNPEPGTVVSATGIRLGYTCSSIHTVWFIIIPHSAQYSFIFFLLYLIVISCTGFFEVLQGRLAKKSESWNSDFMKWSRSNYWPALATGRLYEHLANPHRNSSAPAVANANAATSFSIPFLADWTITSWNQKRNKIALVVQEKAMDTLTKVLIASAVKSDVATSILYLSTVHYT